MNLFSHIFSAVPLAPLGISALVMLVVQGLWYSPFLFARAWIRHTGIRPTDVRPGDTRRNFIVGVLFALMSAYFIGLFAARTAGNPSALIAAVLIAWMFITMEQLSGTLWRREPIALFVLQTFRSLLSLSAGALVYYLWRFL